MRRMMSNWGKLALVVGLVLSDRLGESAQSLAEVARRERERRARLSGREPATVVGEGELRSARGKGLSVVGRAPDASEQRSAEAESADEQQVSQGLSAKEIADLRQKWQGIWSELKQRAERDLESARDAVYQCQAASRYFYVPLAVDCDDAPGRLAEAEARLKEVQLERYHWELLLPGAEGRPR